MKSTTPNILVNILWSLLAFTAITGGIGFTVIGSIFFNSESISFDLTEMPPPFDLVFNNPTPIVITQLILGVLMIFGVALRLKGKSAGTWFLHVVSVVLIIWFLYAAFHCVCALLSNSQIEPPFNVFSLIMGITFFLSSVFFGLVMWLTNRAKIAV